MSIKHSIARLRHKVYDVMGVGNKLPAIEAKNEIKQFLRVEDSVLAEHKTEHGDIIIIQSAQINTQINALGTDMLQIVDELERLMAQPTGVEAALMEAFRAGVKWHDFEADIKRKYFGMAVLFSKNKTEAARRLGVSPKLIDYVQKYPKSKKALSKEVKDAKD